MVFLDLQDLALRGVRFLRYLQLFQGIVQFPLLPCLLLGLLHVSLEELLPTCGFILGGLLSGLLFLIGKLFLVSTTGVQDSFCGSRQANEIAPFEPVADLVQELGLPLLYSVSFLRKSGAQLL